MCYRLYGHFYRKEEWFISVSLYDYQKTAVDKLKNGNILVGGVGSGKSRTALAYYFLKLKKEKPKNLYIITTAKKRDSKDWEGECKPFLLSDKDIEITIDSWNNISKYSNVKNSFFIFDEQRVVGSGIWVKSFIKEAKNNQWLLLSATPGDTWMDYIPVFIANGFYKNRTEFIRRHIVYSNFSKFPKIERYIEVGRLIRLRNSIIVNMHYKRKTISHDESVPVPFDKELFNTVMVSRWNPYEKRPVRDISELCYLMRRVVNSDMRRIYITVELIKSHPKVIIFYNFNYELDLLLAMGEKLKIPTAQWNGHKHEQIPNTDKWLYIVQYAAGAEGWNCIETDTIIFYSQNYSYKSTTQAAGRIDRLNTPFKNLYYYHLRSNSAIDLAIQKAFNSKRNFNDNLFMSV